MRWEELWLGEAAEVLQVDEVLIRNIVLDGPVEQVSEINPWCDGGTYFKMFSACLLGSSTVHTWMVSLLRRHSSLVFRWTRRRGGWRFHASGPFESTGEAIARGRFPRRWRRWWLMEVKTFRKKGTRLLSEVAGPDGTCSIVNEWERADVLAPTTALTKATTIRLSLDTSDLYPRSIEGFLQEAFSHMCILSGRHYNHATAYCVFTFTCARIRADFSVMLMKVDTSNSARDLFFRPFVPCCRDPPGKLRSSKSPVFNAGPAVAARGRKYY